MYSIEEYPPPPRRKPPQPTPKKAGPRIARTVFTILAATLVVAAYVRLATRLSTVTSELEDARSSLRDVRGSLGMLWTTTTRLDESRSAQQEVLRDSIGLVRNYAEGGMRLWETAFEDHERRVTANTTRLQAERRRIDQLVDAATAQSVRLDAVSGRARSLETGADATRATLALLGDSLVTLASRIGGISARVGAVDAGLADARSAHARTDGRVDAIALWVDGFRNENLDAAAVREGLASLAAELRSIALRVDSLGTRVDSTRSVVGRAGPS
jgi:hypothetical protein